MSVGGGGGVGGGVRMDVNEELKFCENSKKNLGWGVGGSVRGVGLEGGGVRVDVNEIEVFVKIQKKKFGGGGGSVGGSGWGVRVDVS